MSFFRWNPIRQHRNDVRNRTEFPTVPITFVPKNYVRQRKNSLYNNLLVLFGGLWAMTISHDMDISEIDTKLKFKDILSSSGLLFGHLVAVPLIIWKLQLHYSIILGAIGMSLMPFFYYVTNPVILSIVICLRVIFLGVFEVSSMIYIVKLARICSRIRGNAVFNEVLTTRSFMMMFTCTANIVSSGWRRYMQKPIRNENYIDCKSSFCPQKLSKKPRIIGTLSIGENTIFVAVAIVVALSGIILIAMYLKPITSLGDLDLSGEPRVSSPYRIFKQFTKTKGKKLAIMITSCAFMHVMIDEFTLEHVTCSFAMEYHFFIDSTKQLSMIFGVMICVSLVDLTGFSWLHTIAICFQLSCYMFLVMSYTSIFNNLLSYLIVYHVLCTCASIEMSVLQILVIQTLGDEEVSAWCFYYVLNDIVNIVRIIMDIYLCTVIKLWFLIAISPLTIIAVMTYWRRFDENLMNININECCSLLIKASKRTLEKSASFDLKIVVEKPEDIRKIETFLQRNYTLKSRSLVPPADDLFSERL